MKIKLKPCPRCGSKRLQIAHIISSRLPWWYYVECNDCHACGKKRLFLWRAKISWNKEKTEKYLDLLGDTSGE